MKSVRIRSFLTVFSCIWTEYGKTRAISPYSVKMKENTEQKNSEYGHFSRSDMVFSKTFSGVLNSFFLTLFVSSWIPVELLGIHRSQRLLAQSQKWKRQKMCEICSKLTIKNPSANSRRIV